ncbi:hypothetical protein [Acrocarpospora sp. B8E8]
MAVIVTVVVGPDTVAVACGCPVLPHPAASAATTRTIRMFMICS